MLHAMTKDSTEPKAPLLMIPGPIEVEAPVLAAMGAPPLSHLDPRLVAAFSRALTLLRDVFLAPDGQPLVVAGSGTLAMEMAVANVVERGDRAVVVDTGYFSARMARVLERHGAQVTVVGAELGEVPTLDAIEGAVRGARPKVVTVTHVDTSTGVLAPVREIAAIAGAHGALSLVDGVCSVGGEALDMAAWGVDLALTASQKALGAPPGLAIVMARPRAMEAHRARKTPPASFYADFAEWLPIMKAYEAKTPAYFATPPVNLIMALEASLASIAREGMAARVARHAHVAKAMRAAWTQMGLRSLPRQASSSAHTLSALYYPDGVDASLVARVRDEGVVIAGGLHPEARTKYFRVGHMGNTGDAEIATTVSAIARALGKDPAGALAAARSQA